MIVPMKKVFVVAQKKETAGVLHDLRDLGVVHVEPQDFPSGVHVGEVAEEVNALRQAIFVLQAASTAGKPVAQERLSDWRQKTREILQLSSEAQQYRENMSKRQMLINQWESWGNFDPEDIKVLATQGIYVQLFERLQKDKTPVPEGVIVHTVSTQKGLWRCVAISRQEIKLPFTVISPPTMSLQQMKSLQQEELAKMEEYQKKIRGNARYLYFLQEVLKEREEALRFEEVVGGMKVEDHLTWLKGYCPVAECPRLEAAVKLRGWGLLLESPADGDKVPTLIKNPPWVEIIKPVFAIINVLPGYKEADISVVFLIFFSIFFGILIGDAGYGLLFLALTLLAQLKLKNKVKEKSPFYLIYVLSGCAIVWGVLTGTFLGTTLLGQFIKPVAGWLTENKNVQWLCFLLGTIHLTIAHVWRFTTKLPAVSAYAELGWVLVLWSAFLKASEMILGIPLWGFVKFIFLGGIGFISMDILWGARNKNLLCFLGNILISLVLSFFSMISAFTDIVSYIRLFAVGLAGVAVADAFNEMALGFGFNSVAAGFMTTFILVLGHLFNIVLCGFGILVHGLRLNVLEFSGHLGLEWAGIKYDPFRKLNKSSA